MVHRVVHINAPPPTLYMPLNSSIPFRPCAESIPCVPKVHVVVAVEAPPASIRPPELPLPTFGGGGSSDDFALLFALLAELEAGGAMIEPSKHP